MIANLSDAMAEIGRMAAEIERLREINAKVTDAKDNLLDEVGKLQQRNKQLLRSVELLPLQDCRFTTAGVADISGRHCPGDRPCHRCEYEDQIEKLERVREASVSVEASERLYQNAIELSPDRGVINGTIETLQEAVDDLRAALDGLSEDA